MNPRKDDERIDGLESVERAWRDLGDETPPDILDQAVLNRARLAVEKPRRAWTFNLTWVHGLATMGVAALALTLFLQLRDEVPETPSPAALEMQLEKAVDERKDEDATKAGLRERRQSPGVGDAARSIASPPGPEYERSEPLADTPEETAPEGLENDLVRRRVAEDIVPAIDEAVSPDDVIVTGHAARAELAVKERVVTGPIWLEPGRTVTDEYFRGPGLPMADAVWPSEPDVPEFTLCRVPGDPDDPKARARASCETFTWAELVFQDLRTFGERGEADRFERLRGQFRRHYPDYPLPEDLAE